MEKCGKFTYKMHPGFFMHDTADPESLDAISPRFGLLSNLWDSWGAFFAQLEKLNDEAKTEEGATVYKLVFFVRHCESLLNRALENSKPGDPETTGPDPELTDNGQDQARSLNEAWKAELLLGLRVPGEFYTSPLTRALETCLISCDGIFPKDKLPIVIENCRESYGKYLSNRRKTRVQIEENFPKMITFESDFQNEDLLWESVSESKENVVNRAERVLDMIFAQEELFVCVTTHCKVINAFRIVVGLDYAKAVPTGGVYPMVIKAVRRSQIHSGMLNN